MRFLSVGVSFSCLTKKGAIRLIGIARIFRTRFSFVNSLEIEDEKWKNCM